MKTQTSKIIFPVLLIAMLTFSGCALNKMVELAKQQNLTVTPTPLELHGDEVSFDMSANLPVKMLKPNTVYTINTYYQYGDQERQLESIEFKASDYPNANTQQPSVSKSFVMPYDPAMDRGNLVIQGVASKGTKSKTTDRLNIAEGIITTSRLVQPSYYASYANHGYNDQEELIPTNVEFYFDQGRSVFKRSEKNSDRGTTFAAFIAEKNVTRTVTITGTHSPEGKDRINSELSQERAEAIEKWYREQMDRYDYQNMADDIRFILKPVIEDWSEFKAMLNDYDGISSSEKSEYRNIINGTGSFEQKEKELQRLSTYKKVFKDIYPQLRTAKTEVLTVKPKKSPEEIATLAKQIAEGRTSADQLSVEEMAYAAAKNPSLAEKKAIYEAAARKEDTWVVHNNLGAVNLEMAMTANGGQKDQYIASALNHFQISNQKNANVEAQANMGMAYAMQGNHQGAIDAFTSALGMNPGNDTRMGVNGAKGAIEIMLAQYENANRSLGGASNASVDQFNKGLAQLLRKDFRNAQTTFEAVIAADRGFVWAHYAAAVAAARQQNENKVVEHLRNAVNADASLKQKALADLEFRNFANSQAFQDILR